MFQEAVAGDSCVVIISGAAINNNQQSRIAKNPGPARYRVK
jgi:hypothetical protein